MKKLLIILLLLVFMPAQSHSGVRYPALLHNVLVKDGFIFSSKDSDPANLVYRHHRLIVVVKPNGNSVASVGFIAAEGVDPHKVVDAIAYVYLVYQMQYGKQLSKNDALITKIWRIFDTITHNCKLSGGKAKFNFDDLSITAQQFPGSAIYAMTPLF